MKYHAELYNSLFKHMGKRLYFRSDSWFSQSDGFCEVFIFCFCTFTAHSPYLGGRKPRAGKMNLDRVFVHKSFWFIITRFLVIMVYTTKHLLVNIHLRIKRGKFDMHKKEEKQGYPWTERSAPRCLDHLLLDRYKYDGYI